VGPSCETKPIRAWEAAKGGTKCVKQTQSAPAQRNRWGKPHPTRGCNCVKQTQFSPANRQAGSLEEENSRNKPNWAPVPPRDRVQRRQTNPIRARSAGSGGTERAKQSQFRPVPSCNRAQWRQTKPIRVGGQLPARRNVRNKPNSRPPRGIGGASPTLRLGATAPNKPNSARPTGRRGP